MFSERFATCDKYPMCEVATLFGEYDLIVRIRMAKPDDLENFVFRGLRLILRMAETKTLITARSEEFE